MPSLQGGELDAKRRHQARAWMEELLDSGLRRFFRYHPAVREQLSVLTEAVEAGRTTPAAAARELLECLRR